MYEALRKVESFGAKNLESQALGLAVFHGQERGPGQIHFQCMDWK